MELFYSVLAVVVVERLLELLYAKRNTSILLRRGGVEFGRQHYPVIVAMHVGFFLALFVEFRSDVSTLPEYWWLAAILFLSAQLARIWLLTTMRGRWTTRIIVLPGEQLIAKGPFKFIRHPNYLIVAAEIAMLPLTFGLYVTACLFSLANLAVLLFVRIPVEERALSWAQSTPVERSGA